ncbi:Peptidylprolyl isomerase [Dehalogenimonas lykanthroporepellens BL-DC-9]|nr:Peptidylprolyl isomerase [Dehalogenimonas lykanthroporepellens BL-DC-9]
MNQNQPSKRWTTPPEMKIDPAKNYRARITTSLGSFTVELLASESPKTVNNFVFLAGEGFYDGVIFHRVIKTFMIQTGDPTGTGAGGPGYRFADELPARHSYDPGIVAMANAGPDTNGSQFFVCTGADSRGLNGAPNYTQFGKVVEGMDIVQAIADTRVTRSPHGEMSCPVEPPVIESIEITEA